MLIDGDFNQFTSYTDIFYKSNLLANPYLSLCLQESYYENSHNLFFSHDRNLLLSTRLLAGRG